ncbi:MAG: flagellar biosynthesis anti-sigma factor FlgM [Synergistaceae bacterium]|nr:flagellar biosynthesis anti-sigma factor FlgM [Synergistaceae bacterium]
MIEKINDPSGVGSLGNVKPRRGTSYDLEDAIAGKDDLAVSPFAREMANISLELTKVPDVREDRVEDLKRQIEEGSYNPDLKVLAARLLWAGINKTED